MTVQATGNVTGTHSVWNTNSRPEVKAQEKHVWDDPCWFTNALGINGNTVGNAAQN